MKKIYLISGILLLCMLSYSQNESSFQYIESSNGMSYPSWETGMTELEFADINMDGFIDILSIGDHGCPNINATEHGIMVWFGDGAGSWSVQMTGDFGYGGIAVGDVNNDGNWDVGYGMHHNYSSTDLGDQLLEVALGDGSGVNWTPWDDGLATNGETWGMFGTDFADVDNDGDLDIGSNSFGSGSGLHVYINQGDGTWIQSFGILPGNSNMRFVFGDINKDGNVDFVVTHDAGIAFFGDGAGNFTNADFNLPQYSFPMYGPDLKDVNNDGGKDLAYINPDGGIMVWVFDEINNLWVDNSGSLPSSGDYQEVQLCDFNTDGFMDIAAFGNAMLTVWRGVLLDDNDLILWIQEFNIITSNNGDCAAFRAGGDVDRNGFPDMTLVETEGSWPSDQNHLKCFKETTPFFLSNIKPVFPKGKEVFRQGSVQFTDWISAVPQSSVAQVKIAYSLRGSIGPWTTLTTGTPNSGRYQWIIPQTISSNNCFLEYTLVEGADTLVAITPKAFTILGNNGIDADFIADSTYVQPLSQIQFTDLSLGLITSWEWDFDNNDTVDAIVRNPVFFYSQPGKYTVKLTVSDGTNSQTEIKVDYITVTDHVNIEDIEQKQPELLVYPNPFTSTTTIEYQLERQSTVIIQIFNSNGQQVEELIQQSQPKGRHQIQWDADALPAGIYYYRIQAGELFGMGKIILMWK
ncbi:MAG: VCBS repeat-containing protein [Bacteroidetes bacterium]|nr:VCBS repeat-containing protein [Bacteroidota bacterium]